MSSEHPWWQTGIIYQIYPRSFQDSNGDGIGDLPGIIRRLDYVGSLGVAAIWLSPIYPSPMVDFGYDVSDYTGIHPIFGTMDDFDRLLTQAHARGLKVILDLVPNHTSNQHPWFQASRSSRSDPKRNWYIWRDPAPNGAPPNNWLSVFGGSAWEFDPATGQYYLHSFVKEQPDLNYRHPDVLPAMLDVMRFWLDRGVDGFRVDVITLLIKDEQLRDNPRNPDWNGVDPFEAFLPIYMHNRPEVHAVIREMRKLIDRYPERVLIGETYLPPADLRGYYGAQLDECHLPFNFNLISLKWDAHVVRDFVDSYDAILPAGAWPNWVIGNHDRHRVATRLGAAQARVANMLLMTLRGSPTTYYGEEIGMEDGEIPAEYVQDPVALNQPEIAHIVGRDPARTPMQWDDSPNAGFAAPGVRTWLPVGGNYARCNVAAESQDPGSMLSLYRALTRLRRTQPSIAFGDYQSLDASEEDVFAYIRRATDATPFLVVLNFSHAEQTVDLGRTALSATIAVSTDMRSEGTLSLKQLVLAPDQGLVLRLL